MLMRKSIDPVDSKGGLPLILGGITAVLASTCCLGPLVLLLLGFSGSWIGNLALLEPYRPFFLGGAVVALFFAWQGIWQPVSQCAPDDVCARAGVHKSYRWMFAVVVLLVLVAFAYPAIAPLLI